MDIPGIIGVMQGRLLPKYMGRYQAHPVGHWQEEFPIAREMGLGCIEFILDYNDYKTNPLMSPEGIAEIKMINRNTGVKVISVCADYFMEAPIHSPLPEISSHSLEVLRRLIINGKYLGINDIVIPCVDQSSLKNDQDIEFFVKKITSVTGLAEDMGIRLSLETDLSPGKFAELLGNLKSGICSVNYDTGNSAALGFNVEEEFRAYGSRISDVHIKDRMLGGGSVPLGTGNTDFVTFFELLPKYDYKGPLIMQAYRDDEGTEIFKLQLDWLRKARSNLKREKEIL